MSNKLDRKIGILGGGQLGKMLIESFSPLNIEYTILEKSRHCPSALVTSKVIEGSLYDHDAIEALSQHADILTYEIEHVSIEALKKLDVPTIPFPSVLEVIQDKGYQKEFYSNNNIPTLDYKLSTAEALKNDVENWPEDEFVLKHRKGGYDGKGVQILDKNRFEELHDLSEDSISSEHGYVIESLIHGAMEVSVIVGVDGKGNLKSYEACEMVFDPKANLMDYLISPARLSKEVSEHCKEVAVKAIKAFKSPGIFAVELFVKKDGKAYVNEIAPRPHNSGHHTIESCYTSQYEQLNRILLELPLGSTHQICSAVNVNLVGPQNVNGPYRLDGLEKVLNIEGVYIHMYGKTESKPYRKLGHYTILGDTVDDCLNKMNEIRKSLTIVAKD
ncbi:MAG: ATP-grasp domain-containing protein [Bacteroidia bacterium]